MPHRAGYMAFRSLFSSSLPLLGLLSLSSLFPLTHQTSLITPNPNTNPNTNNNNNVIADYYTNISRFSSPRRSGPTRSSAPPSSRPGSEALLFQHGGDGGGRGEVAAGRVHEESGGLDAGAEAEEDISLGFFAPFLASVRREHNARA
nr:Glycosyl transferase [Ipomoea batatas]